MDAWIGVVGVIAGVALGLFGNAAMERWRHSYLRRDARTDRQAATLREALDAYTDFVHAWTPLANQIALGESVSLVDEVTLTGLPGLTHRRLATINERVHIESIRTRMTQLVNAVVVSVANGTFTAATADAWSAEGNQLQVDIGTELRRLEAQ